MWRRIAYVLLVCLLIHTAQARKGPEGGEGHGGVKGGQKALPVAQKKWLTLNGGEPVVGARGGLSGVFPEGSEISYVVAGALSLPNTQMYCNVHFTSDGHGVCSSHLKLENYTNIAEVFPNGRKTYNINGDEVKGWFSLDYTFDTIVNNVSLIQNVHTRPSIFDGAYGFYDPFSLSTGETPYNVWLNVEYDAFYKEHKISPSAYIEDLLKKKAPQIISSPEIGFLKEIGLKKGKADTKLLFKFQEKIDTIEPTSKATYGSLLKNLSTIKSFASGILVPKEFIWPINKGRYLESHTSLVPDAHKEGLEVYAYGFSNDVLLSFNYSYDPVKEYLQFIDNSEFSVDGVLSDFSITASESIACLSHNKNATKKSKTLIISHFGASGDFPSSTDLAYHKAIDDGVDVIDCAVQLSKDGVAFCSSSADLTGSTTALTSFHDRSAQIPEIQETTGIFSFDLTWTEIETLKPQLRSPFDKELNRNPINNNKGKILTLPEFLELSKTRNVGVLIDIENVPYLAAKKGLDMITAVTKALSDAGFDKQTKQKVMIQSDDTSVLKQFNQVPSYQRVLNLNRDLVGVLSGVPSEIKKYADAITVQRNSVVLNYPDPIFLTKNFSNVIPAMHAANISVYAGVFRNEFQNFLFDYFSDPYVELATFVNANIDGVITEFPATAAAYMSSPCVDLDNKDLPYVILPVKPGDFYTQTHDPRAPGFAMAPAPEPFISADEVADAPLPPVATISPPPANPPAIISEIKPSPISSPAKSAATDMPIANSAAVLISAIVVVLCLLNVQ